MNTFEERITKSNFSNETKQNENVLLTCRSLNQSQQDHFLVKQQLLMDPAHLKDKE